MARKSSIMHEVNLEKGVRRHVRESGTAAYVVNVSIDGKRQQPQFVDPEAANAYARHRDQAKLHGVQPMGKDQFLAQLYVPGGAAGSNLDQDLLLLDLFDRHATIFTEHLSQVNTLKAFLKSEGHSLLKSSEATAEMAATLPEWLQNERYSRVEAKKVLKMAEKAGDIFMGSRLATHNHWKGLKPRKAESEIDRRGRKRVRVKAAAFTTETVVAVARLLRPCYLLPFWLIVILGLRRSEAMGLIVSDWRPTDRILEVTSQRKGSDAKGRTPTKTPAGVRLLLVPVVLASAIDRYIADHHGAPPTDDRACEEWGERYLLVGVMGGAMDASSFMKALKTAYGELGLTPERIGRFRPIHHLRSMVGARLQRRKAGLSGAAIAEILGHEHPHRNDAAVSPVTARHYNPLESGELAKAYAYLERWTNKKLMRALGTGDLLEISELSDPVTLDAATEQLRRIRPEATSQDILDLIVGGTLPAVKIKHGNDRQIVLVERVVLDGLLATTVRQESDTYCTEEVTKLLACDREIVFRLAKEGKLTEVTESASHRPRSPRGSGALPGGGRRFPKVEVDALAESERLAIERRKSWLTIAQAAAILPISRDTVRRMADRGEITMWRDHWSAHERRLLEPESVIKAGEELEEFTVQIAAEILEVEVAAIRGYVKTGLIRAGTKHSHVRAIDVRRLGEANRQTGA